MIINFTDFHARRPAPDINVARRMRLVCRWVADPAGGKLRAVWAPDSSEITTAARQAEPGRLCLAA
jgi:hypothetical protein